MDLKIELVSGCEGIEVNRITLTDEGKGIFSLYTIVDVLSLKEILSLVKYNGRTVTLVVE